MTARTAPLAGLIAGNRYVWNSAGGGLEDAFGAAPLTLASAAVGGGTDEETAFTHPLAGLIGAYRDVSAASALSEAAAAASLTLASSASSADAVDLTAPFGGLIAAWRGITISPTTQYEYFLSAALAGTVDPLSDRRAEFELGATLGGALDFDVAYGALGAAGLSLAASAVTGTAGASSLTLTAGAFGVAVGNPFVLGAGEASLTLTADAIGDRAWPIVMTGGVTLLATAVAEFEAMTAGGTTISLSAEAIAAGTEFAEASAEMTLEADGSSVYLYLGALADTDAIVATKAAYGTIEATAVAYGTIEAQYE